MSSGAKTQPLLNGMKPNIFVAAVVIQRGTCTNYNHEAQFTHYAECYSDFLFCLFAFLFLFLSLDLHLCLFVLVCIIAFGYLLYLHLIYIVVIECPDVDIIVKSLRLSRIQLDT